MNIRAILIGFFFLFASDVCFAKPKSLEGKWQAVSMQSKGNVHPIPKGISITLHFQPNGTFVFHQMIKKNKVTQNKHLKGTWELKGAILTTKTGKKNKTESTRIQFEGNRAKIIKKNSILIINKIK